MSGWRSVLDGAIRAKMPAAVSAGNPRPASKIGVIGPSLRAALTAASGVPDDPLTLKQPETNALDPERSAQASTRHAAHTRSGVAGMASWSAPPPGTASAIAFMIAAMAAVVAASPAPLTPSGLVVAGTI